MSEHVLSSENLDQKVIHSDGKSRAVRNLLFALVWNGFVFSIIYFQWPELLKFFREDPIFAVFILFPIIGVFFMYSSIADAVDWFKFGEAPLTLNN